MAEVDVTEAGPGVYAVRVGTGEGTTEHRVTVPQSLLEELGIADTDPGTLVRESFAFLLEREPATSILPEFSLEVIGRYFPEYREEIPGRLRA